jgi:hypothetical protein
MNSIPLRRLSACVIVPALLLASRLAAGPIVVFGEKDFYALDAVPAPAGPEDSGQHAFFEAYKGDQAKPAYETALELINPPSWGKTVSEGTHGKIRFHPSFAGGFACRITLDGLLPDHAYILTLNGNPALPGNDLLLSLVPGSAKERYYDFLIVKTDSQGHFDESFGIYLKAGKYDARCYVKDTGDFKIVLYHDYFPFEVK